MWKERRRLNTIQMAFRLRAIPGEGVQGEKFENGLRSRFWGNDLNRAEINFIGVAYRRSLGPAGGPSARVIAKNAPSSSRVLLN